MSNGETDNIMNSRAYDDKYVGQAGIDHHDSKQRVESNSGLGCCGVFICGMLLLEWKRWKKWRRVCDG